MDFPDNTGSSQGQGQGQMTDEVLRQKVLSRIGVLMEALGGTTELQGGQRQTADSLEAMLWQKSRSREHYLELAKRLIGLLNDKIKTLRGANKQTQPGMGSGMPGGSVSQLQQRLTGSQMPRGAAPVIMQQQTQPNMTQGQRMAGISGMGMMQGRMSGMPPGSIPSSMPGQGMVMMNRGPPPMYMNPSANMMNASGNMMPTGGSPNMGMMPSPVGASSQYIHSPAQVGMMPSPSGGQRSMVPSPMSGANTPQNEPPGSQEDQQYLEKVKQLGRYIEPLRKMIARIGNEDQNKLDKMKKLMDILSNPSKRMPMDTLIKCEAVLNRMNFDTDVQQPETSVAATSTSSSINPFIEAIVSLRNTSKHHPSVNMNHTLNKIFSAPLEALYGTDITLPPLPKKRKMEADSTTSDIPDVLQGEVARLQSHFRVSLDPAQPSTVKSGPSSIHLVCHLDDANLPAVPSMSVVIPPDYPETSPICDTDLLSIDYEGTSFLRKVHEALSCRLTKMPSCFTLSQLLNAWEMSVRSACSPKPVNNQQGELLLGM